MKGPTHMSNANLVRVERNRGRISLGRIVDLEPGDLYEVTVEDDGTIVLRPVTVVHAKGQKKSGGA